MNGKVVVLGSGPAGLSAAWKLSGSGVEVEVLESQPYIGGLSHTVHWNGYLFDFGPHRFHTDNPAVLEELEAVVGPMPERIRKTRVLFRGSYYDYPLSATNLLSSLSPWLGLTCFVDFMATWLRNRIKSATDDSFESWVVNRFGRRLYDVYFGPYTAKVWGRDPSKLSASWAAQRVAVVDLWDLVLRVLNVRRGYNHFHHSPYKPGFFYPLEGVGHIYNRLGEEIRRNGGRISLGSTVREIICDGSQVTGVVIDRDGRTETINGDYFVSTLPLPATAAILRPLPPDDVLAAASSLKFRAMIFLFLVVNRESVTDDHWIYVPEPKVLFNRISEMKNFTPNSAPPGQTSLTLEISCDQGDEIWNAPEGELFNRSVSSLEEAGLVKRDEVLDHFFLRTPNAYPTYDINFEVNVARLAYHFAGLENIVLAGRQALFRYINQDHAIEMGLCAAEEILSQQIGTRVGRVGAEQVYFG